MSRLRNLILAFTVAATFMAILPSEADADGPLRRWLRGLRGPKTSSCLGNNPGLFNRQTAFAAQTFQQPQVAGAAPNAYGLQPGQCMKTCQQTCSRTVVNYTPYTAYRTNWNRVPVTQYRPVTNSDPVTGCTVTCMRPCTSYTYQMQRVPYTTYRPVYRTETYKVPVTTITNDCATGNCGTATGCATCPQPQVQGFANQTPVLAPQNLVPTPAATTTTNYMPGYIQQVPAPTTQTYYEPATGAIAPTGSYGTTTTTNGNFSPADSVPSLLDGVTNPQSSQVPFMDRLNPGTTTRNFQTSSQREVPAMINIENNTARSPIRERWSYSPVRMASYSKPTTTAGSRSVQAKTPQARQGWSSPSYGSSNSRQPAKKSGWVEVK
ncbi:MAG: hypothetical protein AB8B55_01395 [Mariniblastus sp.]